MNNEGSSKDMKLLNEARGKNTMRTEAEKYFFSRSTSSKTEEVLYECGNNLDRGRMENSIH